MLLPQHQGASATRSSPRGPGDAIHLRPGVPSVSVLRCGRGPQGVNRPRGTHTQSAIAPSSALAIYGLVNGSSFTPQVL